MRPEIVEQEMAPGFEGFMGDGAQMGHEDHVIERAQGFGEMGFALKDIQSGAGDGAVLKRRDNGKGIDNASPGDIDQNAVRS